MLYIHKFPDLNGKSAEIESVPIIRDIKKNMPPPFSKQKLEEYVLDCLISKADIEVIESKLPLVEPTINMVRELLIQKDHIHEPINLQRTIQILKTVSVPLLNNITYLKDIHLWQNESLNQAAELLNMIPKLNTKEEKIDVNEKINKIFEKILRNKEMCFNGTDIIHEGHISNFGALSESLGKRFLFHTTLEEELKKLDFNSIKLRIPLEKLKEAGDIEKNVMEIRNVVEQTYNINMRMINYAVILYSCIKLMLSKQ